MTGQEQGSEVTGTGPADPGDVDSAETEAARLQRPVVSRSGSKSDILDQSLVLASQGIRHWIEFDGTEFILAMDPPYLPLARKALDDYAEENRGYRVEDERPPPLDLLLAPFVHLAIPTFIHFWVGFKPSAGWWHSRGNADSGLILDGEWWRCVTATVLHADNEHYLGNMVSGFFILNLLNHRMGLGTMMAAATLGAAATNFLVALASGPGHVSRGFSSVVFCALGMLAAMETLLRPRNKAKGLRQLSPLLAAFFIAVMVGLGENADVKAHFYGFGLGAALGVACRFLIGAGAPGASGSVAGPLAALARPAWQAGMVAAVYGLYALAWVLAAR